jgi:hypothetical protein
VSDKYTCHQCFGRIDFDNIAHLDLYADLCWIQCDVCELAFGPSCGMDRTHNPHPHGYFECPLRVWPAFSSPPPKRRHLVPISREP